MPANGVRIDKWLWAARFFKTRSAAQQAIEGGKVKLNGERTKAAKELKPGDELLIHIGAYEWTVRVIQLSAQRGPAAVAPNNYTRKRREPREAGAGSGKAPQPSTSPRVRSRDSPPIAPVACWTIGRDDP